MVLVEHRGLKVCKGREVLKEILVLKERKAHKELKDLQDPKVYKVHKVL